MGFIALALCLSFALCTAAVGEIPFAWMEGEAFFPDEGAWTYHYTYSYPVSTAGDTLSLAINEYFTQAQNEMMNLVLPMYAQDPIMALGQKNSIMQAYSITRNDSEFVSFLMRHEQTMGESRQVSLRSVVFAAAGEYLGETLTLRGLARVGESSEQLAQAVLVDIWRQISADIAQGSTAWKDGLTLDLLTQEFYPQQHFFADENGQVVFYLQPGEFRPDSDTITFAYTPEEILDLLDD